MTVKSSERKIVYIGNGTTSEFNVPFVFFKNTDIQVSIFDGSLSRPLEQDVDYTIEGAGDEAGGTVTTKTPVPNGYEIAIIREVPYTQEMEIPENDIFSSKNMERALDRLTQQTIQLKELADRAVTVGVFSDSNPSEVVGEIEALYDVKEQVVTAAENIGAIVVAANDIEAIKDAPEQAAAAIESAASAAKSADTSANYAQEAHADSYIAKTSAETAVQSAQVAEKAAEQAVYKTVGEIFFTSRKGSLAGAVDADGSVYSFDAFTGTESVPSLLQKGELDYVSFAEYESIISTKGSCRFWGWDNGDIFRVPTAEKMKRVLVAKKEPSEGSYDWYNLYSDGWLEQGGYIYQAGNTTGVANTTTFPRAFKNNDYSLTMFAGVGNSGWDFANGVGLGTGGAGVNERESHTTPTTFTWFNATGVSGAPIFWEAKGYAEIPTEAEYQFQNIETHRAMVQLSTGIKEDATQLKEYKFNNPHFFGQSMWSDVDPKNSSWLISNGNFHKGATYTDMYKQLQVELNDSLNVGDTVEIDGRTFVKRGLPVKLLTDTYDDYDFVVNTVDQTFRLPLLNGEESLQSNRYDVLTLQATGGKYTAPANGWFQFNGYATDPAGVVSLVHHNKKLKVQSTMGTGGNPYLRVFLPCDRGDVVRAEYYNLDSSKGSGIADLLFIYAKGNGSLYFYVGDTVQDASLIKASEALDYLSKLNTVHCVVETFKSGSSWYRVYDDGWVEQGGASNIPALGTTISFLKPFADTNYSLAFAGNDTSADAGVVAFCYRSRTAKSFVMDCGYNGTFYASSFSWVACGYGA